LVEAVVAIVSEKQLEEFNEALRVMYIAPPQNPEAERLWRHLDDLKEQAFAQLMIPKEKLMFRCQSCDKHLLNAAAAAAWNSTKGPRCWECYSDPKITTDAQRGGPPPESPVEVNVFLSGKDNRGAMLKFKPKKSDWSGIDRSVDNKRFVEILKEEMHAGQLQAKGVETAAMLSGELKDYPPKTRIMTAAEINDRDGYLPGQLIEVLPNGNFIVGECESEAIKRLEEHREDLRERLGKYQKEALELRDENARLDRAMRSMRSTIASLEDESNELARHSAQTRKVAARMETHLAMVRNAIGTIEFNRIVNDE
jgi:phage FluMu protein Com